jgi:hypothetical protein
MEKDGVDDDDDLRYGETIIIIQNKVSFARG